MSWKDLLVTDKIKLLRRCWVGVKIAAGVRCDIMLSQCVGEQQLAETKEAANESEPLLFGVIET